jgi:predicted small lipoprotein YifL
MVSWRQKYVIAGLACAVVAGCGLKGPLRKPDEHKPEAVPSSEASNQRKRGSSPVPAPQSQKKDTTTGQPPESDTTTPVPPPDPGQSTEPTTPPPGR